MEAQIAQLTAKLFDVLYYTLTTRIAFVSVAHSTVYRRYPIYGRMAGPGKSGIEMQNAKREIQNLECRMPNGELGIGEP